MHIDAVNPPLGSPSDAPSQRRRAADSPVRQEEVQTLPVKRSERMPASRKEVTDSLRRFAHLDNQLNGESSGNGMPLRARLALDAYVGAEREEQKRFLHETLGIDTYA